MMSKAKASLAGCSNIKFAVRWAALRVEMPRKRCGGWGRHGGLTPLAGHLNLEFDVEELHWSVETTRKKCGRTDPRGGSSHHSPDVQISNLNCKGYASV